MFMETAAKRRQLKELNVLTAETEANGPRELTSPAISWLLIRADMCLT